mmetsp:Transcript_11292/g.34819  ORF Transcript_11292/g.34819 Transcript_11292/m.34819 type:complete len:88 (-) Transcript_11292:2395-2658(-)|eukprot:scaffold77099_cov30-Tisochrysis_lutea.AAC.1
MSCDECGQTVAAQMLPLPRLNADFSAAPSSAQLRSSSYPYLASTHRALTTPVSVATVTFVDRTCRRHTNGTNCIAAADHSLSGSLFQ